MIHAKLNADGPLSELRYGPQQPGGVWSDGSHDVPLASMPAGLLGTQDDYGASTRTARPVPPRVPRSLSAVLGVTNDGQPSLDTLTAAQLTTLWNDLARGMPPKILADRGTHGDTLFIAHGLATGLGLTGAALTYAMKIALAVYVVDHPNYLVNPSFDPTIAIPGDAPSL